MTVLPFHAVDSNLSMLLILICFRFHLSKRAQCFDLTGSMYHSTCEMFVQPLTANVRYFKILILI